MGFRTALTHNLLQGWPLWAQTLSWQPEPYAPLVESIAGLLSPADAQTMTPCDVDDNGLISGIGGRCKAIQVSTNLFLASEPLLR